MADVSTFYLILILFALVTFSAFFSGAETGLMSLNRYRVRHLARKGQKNAMRTIQLLKRPDRLLGVVLIGNTFANVVASAVTTVIIVRYFNSAGILLGSVVLTLLLLIFAEITPKTFAALHPQRAAFSSAFPLQILLRLLFPIVWLVNAISNGLLRLFGVKVKHTLTEALSAEELRTVVREATGKISSNYQQMLLKILSLGHIMIEDVMVPRHRIDSIDITDTWDNIRQQLLAISHSYVPIYRENIDRVIGMLNMRKLVILISQGELTHDKLIQLAEEVYFIPGVTSLNHQLIQFQEQNKTLGLVIDEYGDIQGLVTLQDILKEIVGEFAWDVADRTQQIKQQADGSYLVDGRIAVRDLNRTTKWELPTSGPKTLSGLIIEYLEMIPPDSVSLCLAEHPMEVIKVSRNTVRLVQIWPTKKSPS